MFAEALHEGLVRTVRGSSYQRAAASQAVPLTCPAPSTPLGDTRHGDEAGPSLRPRAWAFEPEAILDRFRLGLPALLSPSDREPSAPPAVLVAFARRALAGAGRHDREPAPAEPLPAAVGGILPHQLIAAVGLLYESALIHALESSHALGGTALPRAVNVLRALADPLRAAAAAFWWGDDDWSESRRLARRLHDELGSVLAVALHRIELSEDDPERAAIHLAVARQALREAAAENRSLIAGLRRSTYTPPIREALQSFLADLAPHAHVTIQVVGDETIAPERCRRELFLMLRELLRNCLAHARAERVEVTVRTTRRWVYARVQDDGVGFVAGRIVSGPHTGHGLISIRERAEELGGRLRVVSGPGEGTRAELHVPLGVRP
ncbi:sensor histidine kinase [Streptomyces jumonjinensis]|uniref:sensor histidine kinase n=1 Tax=Streptomyces jumonjinensis TaxID=1945 RepID=UPI00379529C7